MGIKILANNDGQRMLRMLESRPLEGSRGLSEAVNIKVADPLTASKRKFENVGCAASLYKFWARIAGTGHCPMLFTSFGSGKEMSVTHLESLLLPLCPQLWQPSSGALMSNDSSDAKSAEESLLHALLYLRTILMSCLLLLCIWNIDGWEKEKGARLVQAPPGTPYSPGWEKLEFNSIMINLTFFGIQGTPLSAPISSAIYSCDGMLVFAGFSDGAIGIFDADSFRLRCRIAASAYISSSIGSSSGSAFPVVIAAHPSDANQFALGMNDGSVNVIEPSDAEPKWGSSTSQDNGSLPSIPSSSALNSQPSETASR
nr:protein TPR2-like isoform X2 [Ipomoea batatas]